MIPELMNIANSVGGPSGCEEVAKRCTERNRSVGPTLTNGVKPDPKDIAAKVQGMFVEVMLKAMEESVDAEEGLFGRSMSSDMYRGMLREHFARAMAEKMGSPLEQALGAALTHDDSGKDEHSQGDPAVPFPQLMPVTGVITSAEGWRRDPINGETRYHAGTDIAAPVGTTIRAVEDGRVIESGAKGGYGNTVVIETEDGRKMLYAHNNRNFVRTGDWVSRGEPIAEVGATGRATGPHVHFEVKF